MFKLLIADDEGKTTVVPLVRDEITIGRKEGNTIRLTERNISRKHAKIRRSNGAFMLEDLASYNGVRVNGKKIGAETTLKPGDQIVIGDYQLALQLEGETGGTTIPEQTAPTGTPAQNDAVTAMISAPPPTISPMSGPPARLVMMSPPAPGAEYALSRDRMRIGRAEDLEIWVNHRSISREHAEVVNENGKLVLRDLASANGLRVNGSDTRSHELKAGDVIELGQVRFRYVPQGEAFTFDEGRTMQMEAISGDVGGAPNRTPLYVGGGIVGIALLAGAVILFSGGSDDQPRVVDVAPLPATAVAPSSVAVPASITDQVSAAIAACATAVNSGQFDVAIAHAQQALALRPGDASARDCEARAVAERDQGQTYQTGLAAVQNGDYQGAYLSFEALPLDSAYRQRPEVIQAFNQFATETVIQAEGMAVANPTEANRLAATVLVMTGLDPALTARAQLVDRQTRTHAAVGVRPRTPTRVPMPPPPPTTGRTIAPPPPPTSVAVRPPPTSAAPPPTSTASAGGANPALVACITAGDNRCIIQLLGGGRAHTAAELRALFGAQRAVNDRAGACVTARSLLTAPGVSAAVQAQIRQYQATQCQ